MYADKYIALLEEENARLKKRNAELEEKLKETKRQKRQKKTNIQPFVNGMIL